MNLIKTISINVIITLALVALILLCPPVIYATYTFFKPDKKDDRASLVIYQKFDWAEVHFEEFRSLDTTYFDFVVWKRNDFTGETITIKDGTRKTINSVYPLHANIKYAFFGGSTMWGTGSTNELTIPSQFTKQTKFESYNFGETGYTSRQVLANYINFILGNRIENKDITNIVFYGGSADVTIQCRENARYLSTQREKQIQQALRSEVKYSYAETFRQVIELIQRVFNNPKKITHDCHSNPEKAKVVARTIVDSWRTAQHLSQTNNLDFIAVLEPHGYSNSHAKKYLNLDPSLAEQYRVVYPLIRRFAEEENINFFDLSFSLNNCRECFIDDLHIGPQGNQRIVKSLISIISSNP
jgi:hypothetical protein